MRRLIRPLRLHKITKDECTHEWKTKVQMVTPSERTKEQSMMGMDYLGGRAAFKLRECINCKKKEYLGYKVERM